MRGERRTQFGSYFARLRRERTRLSLRQFCDRHGFDPGNISKLERGRLSPPQSLEVLEKYARALGLKKGSDEWYEFFDLAAAARGEIPADILEDTEVVSHLPILFRTLRGERVPNKQLKKLIEIIRRA
jgi:transcriptional regulator with XRE-family HTH domain